MPSYFCRNRGVSHIFCRDRAPACVWAPRPTAFLHKKCWHPFYKKKILDRPTFIIFYLIIRWSGPKVWHRKLPCAKYHTGTQPAAWWSIVWLLGCRQLATMTTPSLSSHRVHVVTVPGWLMEKEPGRVLLSLFYKKAKLLEFYNILTCIAVWTPVNLVCSMHRPSLTSHRQISLK